VRIRNEIIRDNLEINNLEYKFINDRTRWYGHISRLNYNITANILITKLKGKSLTRRYEVKLELTG
jgi:hypothetical protein